MSFSMMLATCKAMLLDFLLQVRVILHKNNPLLLALQQGLNI